MKQKLSCFFLSLLSSHKSRMGTQKKTYTLDFQVELYSFVFHLPLIEFSKQLAMNKEFCSGMYLNNVFSDPQMNKRQQKINNEEKKTSHV